MYKEHSYKRFSFSGRIKSFSYAWSGLRQFFTMEHNARIHLAATIVTIMLLIALPCSKTETMLVIISVALVWAAELFNTAIERLADAVTAQHHTGIKLAKDISAAAVLVVAAAAFINGIIIFIPKIIQTV